MVLRPLEEEEFGWLWSCGPEIPRMLQAELSGSSRGGGGGGRTQRLGYRLVKAAFVGFQRGKDSLGSQARDHLYKLLAKVLMVSCPCPDSFRSGLKNKLLGRRNVMTAQ